MISQFFIVSPRGDTLIFKDYRGDVPRVTSEVFWRKVKFSSGEAEPVFVSVPTSRIANASPPNATNGCTAVLQRQPVRSVSHTFPALCSVL